MQPSDAWTQIPTTLLDATKRQADADAWATAQRARLADVWANVQRQAVQTAADTWQKGNDAASHFASGFQGALQGATGSGDGSDASQQVAPGPGPSYNDMAGASSGPTFGTVGAAGMSDAPTGPQASDATAAPLLPGNQPVTDALSNVGTAIGNQVANTEDQYSSAMTPTYPADAAHPTYLSRFTPEQTQAKLGLASNMVMSTGGEGIDTGVSRMFHGTGSAFDKPNAASFDPNGLFGPGYYLTSDPRVASSYAQSRPISAMEQASFDEANQRIANLQQHLTKISPTSSMVGTIRENIAQAQKVVDSLGPRINGLAGPNVRAVNVPSNLRLLDADAPIDPNLAPSIQSALPPNLASRFSNNLSLEGKGTNGDVYQALRGSVLAPDANRILGSIGYDGIRYNGGQRIPMQDEAGKNIEHTAVVIFPQSMPKLTNALSGTVGGSPPAIGGALLGGYAGYQSDPNASPQDRVKNALVGAGLGAAGGYGLAKAGESGQLGRFVRDESGPATIPGTGGSVPFDRATAQVGDVVTHTPSGTTGTISRIDRNGIFARLPDGTEDRLSPLDFHDIVTDARPSTAASGGAGGRPPPPGSPRGQIAFGGDANGNMPPGRGPTPGPGAGPGAGSTAADARAGNILLNKYVSPDVQQVIADAAARDPAGMEAARRGVVSDATVQQLADAAGTTAQRVIARWRPGDIANAETINAMRAALSTKSQQVYDLAQTVRTANTPENLLNLQVALHEQDAIQKAVTGGTAELGRGLRALRANVQSAVASGNADQMQAILRRMGGTEWTAELADRLSRLDPNDAQGRYDFLRNAIKPQLKDYLTELWYNAMLSGPHTLAVKTTSELLSLALSPLERVASAAADLPLSAIRGGGRQRFFGEAPADIVGMVGGIREGVDKALYTMQHGYSMSDVLNTDYLRPKAFKGPLGAVINAPSNILAAGVEMMSHIAEAGALNAGAYRQAASEGLNGPALAQRIADLRATPSPALLKYAQQQGAYRTFQQAAQPNSVMAGILNVRGRDWNGIPVGRILVPFFQTPVNLLKVGLERSPMAALNPAMWSQLAKQSPEAADSVGRWLMGSSIGAAIALEVGAGNITGAAPTSPAAADSWRRQGKTAYSLKIGDKWVSYQRVEPLNQTIGQVASIVDSIQKGQDVQNAVGDFFGTMGANFVSQPYMQSLSSAMGALKDPARAMGLFQQNMASSMVPAAARVVAQHLDPTQRQVSTPLEAMQADIPGLSQQLPPRLDAFGQPRGRLTSDISPIGVSQATTDPVDAELTKYGVEPGFTGKTLRGMDLTRQENADHQRLAGQLVKQNLQALIADPRYKALNDLQKAAALQRNITHSKDVAARQYVGQLVQQQGLPTLLQRIQQKKLQRLPKAG